MHVRRISVTKYPYPYPYPFKHENYYPYPIRILSVSVKITDIRKISIRGYISAHLCCRVDIRHNVMP